MPVAKLFVRSPYCIYHVKHILLWKTQAQGSILSTPCISGQKEFCDQLTHIHVHMNLLKILSSVL